MPVNILEIIQDKAQQRVLATIMRGGKNFWDGVKNKEFDCLESCPAFHNPCKAGLKGRGPDNKICSASWRQSVLTPDVVDVLFHVFNNFDYYNQDDQPNQNQKTMEVTELRRIFYDLSKKRIYEYLDDEESKIINSQEEPTTIKALIDARRGQGRYRSELIAYWRGCAVTTLKETSLLRASHIKPWRNSTNKERLDVFNGLLLIPNLDLAFDKGFITFDKDGDIIISDRLTEIRRAILKIHDNLKIKSELLTEKHRVYLQYHRENVFEN